MWLYFLMFAIGLVMLIKGANIVVKFASKTARLLGISNFMIGLTLVAFSTTLPELSVSLMSAFYGVVDIATGTVLGSIIANVALILALAAVFVPLVTDRPIIRMNYLLLVYLLVFSLLFIDGLVWYEGLALIVLFVFYIVNLIKRSKEQESGTKKRTKTHHDKGVLTRYIVFTMIGGGIVVLGARLLIDSVINISVIFELPEMLIALLAVAIGTSLPELAVVMTAAYKKMVGISIGDILGANMFNIMAIGATSLITPIPASVKVLTVIIPIILLVHVLLLIFMGTKWAGSKKWQLSRTEGIVLLAIYAAFVWLQFV